MYIFKNALKNLGRNKGRNSLLGIIILILILATTVSLIINSTSSEIINDYKTRFGSKVALSVNFDKLMEESHPNADGSFNFPEASVITPEQYLAFTESEMLKSYQMNMLIGVIFDDLKVIGDSQNGSIGNVGGVEDSYMPPSAKLLGYSDSKILPDFANGLRKLMDGKFFKSKNECIVSSDFTDINHLKVGDSFQAKDSTSGKEVTLKIAGIYADATKEAGDLSAGTMSLEGSYGNRRNEILVHTDTMKENFKLRDLSVSAEYELKSPDLVESFEKELRQKGLSEDYDVVADKKNYDKIVAPVVGLSKVSMTFMYVILLVGGIILLFSTTMAIRERKYEFGVLCAMGMSKIKIAIMLVSETFLITIICLVIGLGIGNAFAQPVANNLITSQVEAQNSDASGEIFYTNGAIDMGETDADATPLKEIDVSLMPTTVVQISIIALFLVLLSSIGGVIFITKYEPMKILSERN